MSRRRVNTVILCEDLQHEVFVYRFLEQSGRVDVRNVTVKKSSRGRGSGAQYVLDHFWEEVKAYRRKSSHRSALCLIVVIDADKYSVDQRVRQLDDSLEAADQERRTLEERIVILVAKRNIETWVHYLMGTAVDETTSYPKPSQQSECIPAVTRLVDLYPNNIPDDAPDSLQRACAEGQRCGTRPSAADAPPTRPTRLDSTTPGRKIIAKRRH